MIPPTTPVVTPTTTHPIHPPTTSIVSPTTTSEINTTPGAPTITSASSRASPSLPLPYFFLSVVSIPEPTATAVVTGYGYGKREEKRQLLNDVGPYYYTAPGSEDNCATATEFNLLNNMLYDVGDGNYFVFSFTSGHPYAPFALPIIPGDGTYSTVFSQDGNGVLHLDNPAFNYGQGNAYFCQLNYPNGQVQVLFAGPQNYAYPTDCTAVELVVLGSKFFFVFSYMFISQFTNKYR